MKQNVLWCLLLTVGMFIFGAGPVRANEGQFVLSSNSATCIGISIWQDQRFHVLGRCQGLVYPYRDTLTTYSLWAQHQDTSLPVTRIDDIENGIIEGSTVTPFTGLFITAESEVAPQKPAGVVIASAPLQSFNFQTTSGSNQVMGAQTSVIVTPTPSPTPTPLGAAAQGSAITAITRLPLFLIAAIIIIMVVVLALVWR